MGIDPDGVTWSKSSHSSNGTECVEVGTFRKSSHSNNAGGCVEVAGVKGGDGVLVRDSKDKGAGPVLRFTAAEWTAFKAGVRDGEFD